MTAKTKTELRLTGYRNKTTTCVTPPSPTKTSLTTYHYCFGSVWKVKNDDNNEEGANCGALSKQ